MDTNRQARFIVVSACVVRDPLRECMLLADDTWRASRTILGAGDPCESNHPLSVLIYSSRSILLSAELCSSASYPLGCSTKGD